MTPREEGQLVEAIERAVKGNVTSTRSTRPCTCAVCGTQIVIGSAIAHISDRFAVCGDCIELYRLCPDARPME